MEDVLRCVASELRGDCEAAALWSRTCRAAHGVPVTTTTTFLESGVAVAHRGVPIPFVKWGEMPRGVVRWLRWSDRTSPVAAYVAGREGLTPIEAPTWYLFGAVSSGRASDALDLIFGAFDCATATETVLQVMGADLDSFALGNPPSARLRLLRHRHLAVMFDAYTRAQADIPTLRRYALICLDGA